MAQGWFDLARFADTSGYAADRTRTVWPYRDWVVRAFNANQPYDRFSIEQLAGDLLPVATSEQKVASAFHRHAMQAKGNNPRKEEFRIKGIVDRLETTGRTWLGLTLDCAECHDHKHDPISQKEYYQLFAIFNNVPHLGSGYDVHGPRMKYVPLALRHAQEKHENRLLELRAKLGKLGTEVPEGLLGEWQQRMHVEDAARYAPAGSFTITAEIQTLAKVGDILSKYDWEAGQRGYVFGVGGEGDAKAAPGKLFAWVSAEAGRFNGVTAYGSIPVDDGRPHHVAVVFEAGKAIRFYVDGREDKAVRIEGHRPGSVARNTRGLSVGAGYKKSLTPNAYAFEGSFSNVRLYDRALANPAGLDTTRPEVAEYLRVASASAPPPPRAIEVPVMQELHRPRETHVLVRGNFKEKGEAVRPGVPAFLPPIGESPDRLDFARWLFRPEHPLTARVAVNRIWQHHFGEGLVRTVSDFGRHGEPPSHPQLLDWLALQFVRSGWDVKAMHRLIVTSATYRQASACRPDRAETDPDNRLLAHFPRVRLPAEQIRDGALVASGLLNRKLGGPSVFPDQPSGLYEERGQNLAANSNFNWKNSTGKDRYRRSLYTYWKRMMLHPVMATFDAPTREVCIARRSITNTPQQALAALNEPLFVETARALGRRLAETMPEQDAIRVRSAFRICLAREPDETELGRCLEFLSRQRARKSGSEWELLAAVLMNLDEWMTLE